MFLQRSAISLAYMGAVLFSGAVVTLPLCAPTAHAVELPYGSRMNVQVPRLTKVSGLHLEPGGNATLYFTIHVPPSYGHSVEAIHITQIPSGGEQIRFAANQSQVVMGDRFTYRSMAIPLSSIGGSEDEAMGALTLAFAQPLLPGSTVTVAITTERNPLDGIHQFGVTAYPVGASNTSLYLGTGRVTFYGSD
jgi:hypothetical protein